MKKIDSAQYPLKRWVIKGSENSIMVSIYSNEKPVIIEDKSYLKNKGAGNNWIDMNLEKIVNEL